MRCTVCKGVGILDKEQTEICHNCEGAGFIELARSAIKATESPSVAEADKLPFTDIS